MSSNRGVVGNPGMVAQWIGFVAHVATTIYCLRAALMSHSESSAVWHYISITVTTTAALAYLVMALGAINSQDTYYVHFAEWIATTPLLLYNLGMLSHMRTPEIALIAAADVLMIASGYIAEVATDPATVWSIFAFSCVMFLTIMVSLVSHLRDVMGSDGVSPAEDKAFKFLAAWALVFWSGYAALWTAAKVGALSADATAILYTISDINSKDVFGLIIFGVRDVLSGNDTVLARVAMFATGITRSMRRRSVSMSAEKAEELIYALRAAGVVPTLALGGGGGGSGGDHGDAGADEEDVAGMYDGSATPQPPGRGAVSATLSAAARGKSGGYPRAAAHPAGGARPLTATHHASFREGEREVGGAGRVGRSRSLGSMGGGDAEGGDGGSGGGGAGAVSINLNLPASPAPPPAPPVIIAAPRRSTASGSAGAVTTTAATQAAVASRGRVDGAGAPTAERLLAELVQAMRGNPDAAARMQRVLEAL